MKSLHHVSKKIYGAHKLNYRVSHYIDLPDKNVLVVGDIDPAYREALELEPGTTALPFILSGEKLPANVVKSLAHLGVTEQDDTMKACLKIRKMHPAFHPSAL